MDYILFQRIEVHVLRAVVIKNQPVYETRRVSASIKVSMQKQTLTRKTNEKDTHKFVTTISTFSGVT